MFLSFETSTLSMGQRMEEMGARGGAYSYVPFKGTHRYTNSHAKGRSVLVAEEVEWERVKVEDVVKIL